MIIYDLFRVSDYAPFTGADLCGTPYAGRSFSKKLWV